jgi:hypothetical protein
MKTQLARIAHARSGDKGDRVDIGLFAYDEATYQVLKQQVSEARVLEHFAGLHVAGVRCWWLDNLLAAKIVLDGALQGGASRSLRIDNLGKTMAAALLRMEIDAPASLPRLQATPGDTTV